MGNVSQSVEFDKGGNFVRRRRQSVDLEDLGGRLLGHPHDGFGFPGQYLFGTVLNVCLTIELYSDARSYFPLSLKQRANIRTSVWTLLNKGCVYARDLHYVLQLTSSKNFKLHDLFDHLAHSESGETLATSRRKLRTSFQNLIALLQLPRCDNRLCVAIRSRPRLSAHVSTN
jgi:hypothetical protein